MTLLRAASRTMLASYFVSSGIKAVRHPELLVPAAEPVADKLVPLLKKYAPGPVAGYVPEDTKTLVRVNGAAQVLGALALATGKGRRLGAVVLAASLVPSTLARHPFWTRTTAEEKAQDRSHFLKNVSLLGGVLLAANDTEGKPSIVWRAHKGGELLVRDTRRATKRFGRTTGITTGALTKGAAGFADSVSKNASELAESVSKSTGHLTEGAMASGAALVGAAVSGSRAAKKKATQQLKERQVAVAKQLKEAQEAAAKQAKAVKKEQVRQARIDQKEGVKQAKIAEKRDAQQAKIDAKVELKQAKVAEREHLKAAALAEKKAAKAQKHIERGEN
jgi:uncharacterized membrane protein YphA (DoxX/SURF4 family)